MLSKWEETSSSHGISSIQERKLPNWLESYLEYTFNTEPAVSFHRWVGLGCVAAALQRKVYMDWGPERIFPNLYVVLLGPAAQTRKSTALRIGEELVKALNIPIIGQDNSPEAVIRNIKGAQKLIHEGSHIKSQSAVTCFASELAVFLGRQNTEFQAYMTDWYDSPERWTRSTKHQGIDDISGMCFTLIGAMAPDWVPYVFSPESIGGGFTSRIMFVYANRKAKTISDPNKFPMDQELHTSLVHDLEKIHTLIGPYVMSEAALKFYVEWYEEDDAKIQESIFQIPDRAFQTYCGRRSTLLRKLGMCIAATKRDELVVEEEDVRDALKYMVEAEATMPGVFSAVGKSHLSAMCAIISDMIEVRKELKRSDLLKVLYKDISPEDLQSIELLLEQTKLVDIRRVPAENDTYYKWMG